MEQSSIDRKHGIIYLTGDVDIDMYDTLSKGLNILSAGDFKKINIVLNTHGGELYQALAIYDLLRLQSRDHIIRVVGVGCIMSAGIIIMCAGDERVATPLAQFLIHYGQETNDSTSLLNHNKMLFKLMKNLLKEKVTCSQKTITSWFNKETYMTSEEALKVGLIKEILK